MGIRRRAVTLLVVAALGVGACSAQRESGGSGDTLPAPSTTLPGLPALSAPPTAIEPPANTRRGRNAERPRRTTTTTSTLVPYRRAHNPKCVVQIREGDSLYAIAEASGKPAVTIRSLQRENRIGDPHQIRAGDLLDICVRNKINDITGEKRVPPTTTNPPRRRRGN